MIALKILETKPFMASLLKSNLFDEWEGRHIEISTFTKFTMDCKVNKSFYTTEEYEVLPHKAYASWQQLKGPVFQIIKGHKPPSSMKIVLSFPLCLLNGLDTTNIDGLFVNIHFEDNGVTLTSGTSMNTFTLDKSVEIYWDNYIQTFIRKASLPFEVK